MSQLDQSDTKLGENILHQHKNHKSTKNEASINTLQVQTYDNKTLHEVPENVNIGVVVKTIIDESNIIKPTFEYSKNKAKYAMHSKTAMKNTNYLISLFKKDKDEAIKYLSTTTEPLTMTQELMDEIQKYKAHFNAPIARLLDNYFTKFFRTQIRPPYLNEMYYPQDFLIIKKEEDEYRSDPLLYNSHHGLMSVDVRYLKMRGQNNVLIPNINCYPDNKQEYNSTRLLNILDHFIEAVKEAFPSIPLNQLVIAGGSIASLFHDRFNPGTQDLDVFVIGDIEKDKLRESMSNTDVIYNNNVISKRIFVYNLDIGISVINVPVKIQLIKRRYNSISEILHGFDIDSSCIGVECHTKQIYVSKRFDYAYRNGFNTVDLDRLSPSYESRLYKYSRRCWGVFIPGISTTLSFKMTDERSTKWEQIKTQFKPMFGRYGFDRIPLSKRNIWEESSGLVRLFIMYHMKNPRSISYASDYDRGILYKGISNDQVFDHWLTENPGTQHTSSFQPLPNDKSWYDNNISELQELIKVGKRISDLLKQENLFFRVYNLKKLPDGSYVYKNRSVKESTNYYIIMNNFMDNDYGDEEEEERNRPLSLTVYEKELDKFVGTLDKGKIVPRIAHLGIFDVNIAIPEVTYSKFKGTMNDHIVSKTTI